MPERYGGEVRWDAFVQRVRRHRPSDLLPVIAQASISRFFSEQWMKRPRVVTPWATAASAITSVCHGNQHRPAGASYADVVDMCAAHNAVRDHGLAEHEPDAAVRFLLRVMYEQMPFQHAGATDIARSRAMFVDSLPEDTSTLKILSPDLWNTVLDCSLEQFVGIAWLLFAGAMHNSGYFDPAWMEQPQMAEVREVIPAAVVRRVTLSLFCATPQQLRAETEANPPPGRLEKYAYNPLTNRPYIDMQTYGDNRLLAPQPHFILDRARPSGLYYIVTGSLGQLEANDFTNDLGPVFEHYVGRHLRLLRDCNVYPEIIYGKDYAKSVDFFVVFDDLVMLVEAKTTRLRQVARMGGESYVQDLDRTLGKAFRQINTTVNRLEVSDPAFSLIPKDRPVHALVVTLEPYHISNSPFIRERLPETQVRTTVASIRELEFLCALGQHESVAPLIHERLRRDAGLATWSLGAVLEGRELPKNPILVEAERHFPWHEKATALRAREAQRVKGVEWPDSNNDDLR